MKLSEDQIPAFRLTILLLLESSPNWPLNLVSIKIGLVLKGYRDCEPDDVLTHCRAMAEFKWVSIGRSQVNRTVVEIELLEAGRVALRDAGL